MTNPDFSKKFKTHAFWDIKCKVVYFENFMEREGVDG